LRGALGDRPWVEFMTDPRVRLEFVSYQALHRELRNPLALSGWHTFDTS
jgi:hypothetical protein